MGGQGTQRVGTEAARRIVPGSVSKGTRLGTLEGHTQPPVPLPRSVTILSFIQEFKPGHLGISFDFFLILTLCHGCPTSGVYGTFPILAATSASLPPTNSQDWLCLILQGSAEVNTPRRASSYHPVQAPPTHPSLPHSQN